MDTERHLNSIQTDHYFAPGPELLTFLGLGKSTKPCVALSITCNVTYGPILRGHQGVEYKQFPNAFGHALPSISHLQFPTLSKINKCIIQTNKQTQTQQLYCAIY